MKTTILAAAIGLSLTTSAVAATTYPGVTDASVESADQRVMKLFTVIPASRATLWKSLTDAGELQKWNTPVAFVDLRPGGVMETSYDKKAVRGDPNNIKNEFVAIDPDHLMAFRNVQAPQGLPGRDRFGHIVTTITFDEAGPGQTRVTLWQVGYGGGAADKPLWDFFRSGNAYVLAEMSHVYGKGPKPGMPDGH